MRRRQEWLARLNMGQVHVGERIWFDDAMHTLDELLHRMKGHQAKKRPLMRTLHAWGGSRPAPR